MNKPLLFLFLTFALYQCGQQKSTSEAYTPPKPSNLSGKELAQTYCVSCHQLPDPQLLPKEIWQNGVMPNMALRLGVGNQLSFMMGLNTDEMMATMETGVYPENPVLAPEDFQKIVEYYVKNAPEKPLPQAKKTLPVIGLKGFEVKSFPSSQQIPMVTMVRFRPENKTLYVGLRGENRIDILDLKHQRIDSLKTSSPVSDIHFGKDNSTQILTLGIMDPNNQKKGNLSEISASKQSKNLIEKLPRPVQMTYSDLNQDGKEDVLICSFGNDVGKLSWYENGSMEEHILKQIPGSRTTIVRDMNNDKLPDIVALATQARESVLLFLNKGNGEFEEKTLLEFPSVYGSSYFDLVDFNKDGFVDILYTNGDNADYSMCLKNYHGIRIYLNDGKNHFKEKYFYPMYGAAKAVAADFDLDGDMDIAAISFFPDESQKPNEGFLLLDNQGDMNFKISTFKEANQGKWMVMDVADMDADGDSDIVLGSFYKKNLYGGKEEKTKSVGVIILENKTR
jgi:FG-GAP-like repeat